MVKLIIELPSVDGLSCDGCEYFDVNYCQLFADDIEDGLRCSACIQAETHYAFASYRPEY